MTTVFKTSADVFLPGDTGKTIRFADMVQVAIVRYLDARTVVVFADPMPVKVAKTFVIVDAIWHRNGEDYDSPLQSGMEAFGAADMEKQMDGYVPILSSQSPDATLALALRSAKNPADAVDRLTTNLTAPQTHNLIPVILAGHYLGDRLTVSGVNAACELSSRIYRLVNTNSNSFGRQ